MTEQQQRLLPWLSYLETATGRVGRVEVEAVASCEICQEAVKLGLLNGRDVWRGWRLSPAGLRYLAQARQALEVQV
jgi:hypothetical protein